ncbi:MAG: urea ABC transporter substrate-binding protein [Treponema sp.]|uniref:urea ABC transporter substrate-binding protein n=1 Tax=Treponema sp. TaxID=166 RepID=UPI002A9102DD|nr:urea ABC transporter substrate-binding protein [Treponema sp.]MDY6398650.1 urea ABC transporter substrate-binding protein [Treponema sp.]
MKKVKIGIIGITLSALLLVSCNEKKAETVKVGLLHSLSGTMSISETAVRDAELLAISEINQNGGVLGKQIEAIQADGASEPQVFAQKARELLQDEKVVTVFGCWTSASRKAVKPIFEELYGLLWYPVQYEGMEASPNIMYMGASPNQQIVPAVDYCAQNIGKRMFLIGSDYVFPRTANKIIKAQIAELNGECVGEEYLPMGATNFNEVVSKILAAKPDVILNSLNGDSNVSFFAALAKAGITSKTIPVMSFSIAEEEVAKMDLANLAGHLVSWNYYETTQTPRNEKFVSDYKEQYGEDRMTGDPIEAAYIAVYMWAAACEKAGGFEVEAVRVASKGLSFTAPEGTVTIDGGNQHLYKQVRIGKINDKGLIDEVWSTPSAVKPDPYLSTYSWARGL